MLGLGLSLFSNTAALSGGSAAPIAWEPAYNASYTYTNSNLTATRTSGASNQIARVATGRTSGYFEITSTFASGSGGVGIVQSGQSAADWVGDAGQSAGYHADGSIYGGASGGSLLATYAAYVSTDVIMCCIKAGKIYFGKNGTWQSGTDPSAGTGGIDISAWLVTAYPAGSTASNASQVLAGKFSTGHAYAIPTGVTAWT